MADQPVSILVVEDDAFMASLLRFMLERQQMQVHHVADGRAALALLDAAPTCDAVLLDWMLPQASGWQVLTQLRSRADWAATPVLVLSAMDDGAEIARALQAGANDHMTKPFNPEVLNARLQRLLSPHGQGSDGPRGHPGAPRAV